jgi:hypothetical protein
MCSDTPGMPVQDPQAARASARLVKRQAKALTLGPVPTHQDFGACEEDGGNIGASCLPSLHTGTRQARGPKLRLSSQSLAVQVSPPTVTVISTPGGGPSR